MSTSSGRPRTGAVEYSTPWFELVAKQVGGQSYYSLRMPDYVAVVAITADHEVVLVRQYRPAVDAHTLELPAGHVESDQTAEESARCELLEETGFTAPEMELVGTLLSDTGRNENQMWCYLAPRVEPPTATWKAEDGIEVVLVPLEQLQRMILDGRFNHALHVAALMLATMRLRQGPESALTPLSQR